MVTIPAVTKRYWSDTRPNGKPLEAGQLCYIIEVPGEHPIATYGASVEEVLEKVSYTLGHAQAEIARRGSGGNGTRTTTGTPPPPAPTRQRMSANDVMQATSDLGNPARAGEAVTRLVEDATGVNLKQMAADAFGVRAKEWELEHPEFFAHEGNREMLAYHSVRAARGDIASVSKELLTQTFLNLQERGLLFERPAAAPATEPPAPTSFPGGSPVQRVEYPRGGRPGTGTRSTNFRATQTTQPRTPKYTDDDIRKMPASKKRELIEANDPDFEAACERMYANASA